MRVLIKAVAGSHLFGLNTETSDKDYKGVFIPSEKEVYLGNYKDTRNSSTGDSDSRNGKDDIDVEMYSINKFMKMLHNGDTAALELLFTPEEFIIEKDPMWDVIVRNRHKLVSKKINAMVGYIRQQVNKYGVRGSRLGELIELKDYLVNKEKEIAINGVKLKVVWDDIVEFVKDKKHINVISLSVGDKENKKENPALDILGKKFDYHTSFSTMNKYLSDRYKESGQRAREARKNNGIDYKACSHALRVTLQAIDLLDTGAIYLPHTGKDRDLLMKIKLGQVTFDEMQELLEEYSDILTHVEAFSDLPEKLDKEFTDELAFDIMKCAHLIEGVKRNMEEHKNV